MKSFGFGFVFFGSTTTSPFFGSAPAKASFVSLFTSFLYSAGSHVNVNTKLPFGASPRSHNPSEVS